MGAPRPRPDVWIVDTNVVVAGLLTRSADSPPALIVDAMLDGRIRFLLSVELLAEYRYVLLRTPIQERHGLREAEIDQLLERFAAYAVVVDITGRDEAAPDRGDDHRWRMAAAMPGAGLITGDNLLQKNAPTGIVVVTPRELSAR
jgi:uncharacterized protein